jgi:hypothetical protein
MKKEFLYLSSKFFNRFCIYLSVLALVLGGGIYILFRVSEPVFFQWIRAIGLNGWVNLARHKSLSLSLYLPEWVIYSLPNGLWAFAYALLITVIWRGTRTWLKYFWMASIPLLVIGFEILQYFQIIPGTFCLQDIALGIAGMTAGILAGKFTPKPKNHENAFE